MVLAYPATMPDANPRRRHPRHRRRAVRAAGQPVAAAGVRGAQRAGASQAGCRPAFPSNPAVIDRDIPFQISAVAVRAVQEDGGIRSASTLLNLLQQATAVADRTEVLGPIDDPPPSRGRTGSAARAGRSTGSSVRRRRSLIDRGRRGRRRSSWWPCWCWRRWSSKIFGNVGGLNKDKLGLNAPTSSSSSSQCQFRAGRQRRQTHQGHGLLPRRRADNPGQAGQAIDGDPATSWSTEIYTTRSRSRASRSGDGLDAAAAAIPRWWARSPSTLPAPGPR